MAFLPKDKTKPLFSFPADKDMPHFGEEGIGPIQSAKQAEERILRAAKRAGNRHRQGGRTHGKD